MLRCCPAAVPQLPPHPCRNALDRAAALGLSLDQRGRALPHDALRRLEPPSRASTNAQAAVLMLQLSILPTTSAQFPGQQLVDVRKTQHIRTHRCTLKPAHKGTARLRRIPAAVPQLPPHPCTNALGRAAALGLSLDQRGRGSPHDALRRLEPPSRASTNAQAAVLKLQLSNLPTTSAQFPGQQLVDVRKLST